MTRINTLAAAILFGLWTGAAGAQAIGFIDDQAQRNDLQGSLPGMVKFAQSHTIDPRDNSAREQPMLVTERETMVMFVPSTPIPAANWSQLRLDVLDRGKLLGELVLAPPEVFPQSDRMQRDDRPNVLYSTKAWTTRLPWNWVKPGMSLRFRYQTMTGTLTKNNIEFSGASELVLQNIRIGMLAPAPAASTNYFETNTAQAAIDYFQKIPVSRLTVGQYLPVTLNRIVLPDGRIYTQASTDTGGVHDGDMREDIAKALISTGINKANYGIVDSGGRHSYMDHYRQVTVHQSIGRYTNGLVEHGLSGGGGMATLLETEGNEFSHELGHNFDLDHYPGGGRWSSHNPTSGWGYDAYRQRMLANFSWSMPASDNEIEGVITPPFKGLYKFNADPMAGGWTDSALSRYTLHTGYTAKRMQEHFAAAPIVRADSPSGLLRWHARSRAMVQDISHVKPTHFGVPVITLVGFYDPHGERPTTIYPALYGNYGHVYALPAGDPTSCSLDVSYGTTAAPKSIALAPWMHAYEEMNKFHVNLPATPRPVSAAVSCFLGGVRRKLHQIAIAPPSATLPPVLKVGREDTFLSAALRLPTIAELERKPFSSFASLEARLADHYGQIEDWSTSRLGRPGTVYRRDNPQSQGREYFMLQTARYDAFPATATSNAQWRYLGHSGALVKWLPEPFRAQRTAGATLNAKLLAYYNAGAVKPWRTTDPTARVGDIYVHTNPYSKKVEYFQLARPAYSALPTDARTTATWVYLGDQWMMDTAFLKTTERRFAKYVASWYLQRSLGEWREDEKGIVGDVYRIEHDDHVDFFALRKPQYWYFPTNEASNEDWTFLGLYR